MKDALLQSLCTDIFQHIFLEELPEETETEKIKRSKSLELKLGHILYHLRENRLNLKGLLASESGELFMHYMKEHLQVLFEGYMDVFQVAVPNDFLLHYLVGSFAQTVSWWVSKNMLPTPEEVAGYYIAVIRD